MAFWIPQHVRDDANGNGYAQKPTLGSEQYMKIKKWLFIMVFIGVFGLYWLHQRPCLFIEVIV